MVWIILVLLGLAFHIFMQYHFWWWLPQIFLMSFLFILPWWSKLCKLNNQSDCLSCQDCSQCPYLDASDDTM